MKRIIIFSTILVYAISIAAQENDIQIVSNRYTFSFGEKKIYDPGLSNQEYTGFAYGIEGKHGAYYKNCNKNASWYCYDRWQYSRMINASVSSITDYFGINLGFASNYHKKITNSLIWSVGGIAEIYGAVKKNLRNVNNIATGDIQIQMFASTALQYSWYWNKFALQTQYSISSPVIGSMFLAEMGQSYYEIYLNLPHKLDDIILFTAPHNRQGICGEFSVNLIFNGFSLYCGLRHNHQWWQGNHQKLYMKELYGQIGTIVDLHLQCGRKSRPQNIEIF